MLLPSMIMSGFPLDGDRWRELARLTELEPIMIRVEHVILNVFFFCSDGDGRSELVRLTMLVPFMI